MGEKEQKNCNNQVKSVSFCEGRLMNLKKRKR